MKFIDNILYIEFRDFIAAGWNEKTVFQANLRNGSFWQMVTDPTDRRKPLVQYETLRDQHKEKLIAAFGSPYEYVAKGPIKKLVVKDARAEEFFRTYTYGQEQNLPAAHQAAYTTAASWLNMLIKLNGDKKFIKKNLNLSLEVFFSHVTDLIKAENIDLPSTYQRLRMRMAEYAQNGYECLISAKFGNKSASKIGKTEDGFDPELEAKQIALIRRIASMHNNFDAMQVTMLAGTVFKEYGWTMIGHSRMKQILDAMQHQTVAGRRGTKSFKAKQAMHVMRTAPTHPLFYWTLDAWTVELIFQENGTFSNRLVVSVILDAFNKYPIGYAIGERETADLTRDALRNAICHVRDLTGEYFRPWQLQSDNYAIKQLTPFYEAVGKLHTPAAVGNAQAKIIEPYFNYLNRTYCQLAPNWSGHNLTARQENQPNVEFLNKVKKMLPNRQEVIGQIDHIIYTERKAKHEQFIAAWNETPETDKVPMTPVNLLMAFGKPTGYLNTIGGFGLTPTIDGHQLAFDTFDPEFRRLTHLRWQPIYDPNDLSQILAVSECGKHKFLLERKQAIPMDIKSTTPDQHAYRARITEFNKQREMEVIQRGGMDAQIADELIAPLQVSNDQEAALKLMMTDRFGQQKEALQDAKGLRRLADKEAKESAREVANQAAIWQEMQRQFISSNIDISDYE